MTERGLSTDRGVRSPGSGSGKNSSKSAKANKENVSWRAAKE